MIGAAVRRVEDARFLAGSGCFIADLSFPGELHCAVVRSTHAHARVTVEPLPGILLLTGKDMERDGVLPMRAGWRVGADMREPERHALARGVVRHVGEPVAAVLAETHAAAEDLAQAVAVRYEPLPPVSEICFKWERGDRAATDAAFAKAARVVSVDLVNNRLCGAALEGRGAIALWDPAGGTLYCGTQAPHHIRQYVCEELGLDEARLRVVSPDVGGGFGFKGKHYPEETLVAWAARRLRRPVKWIAGRSESFLSDTQGRDHATRAELALDADARFLGVRVRTRADLGAYVSTFGAAIAGPIYSALLAGVYRTPAVHVEVTGFLSNKVPTDAYRGAGRPEACFVLERLADEAARTAGLDRAEIRRRNLIPASAMPYRTPVGPTYDCGDFPKIFERALQAGGYAQFAARKAESARRGKLRGLGLAIYVESSGVAPSRLAGMMGARVGFYESAQVRVAPDASVTAYLGTHNHGQGHATSFAQILSARLGVPLEKITIVEGDTAAAPVGTGTFGSRSIAVGGSALATASAKIVAKGRKIAAHLLEAAEQDIEFRDGAFSVGGTDRRVSFADVAHAAYVPHRYPLDVLEPGLDENAFYDPPNFAFSNGAHVCELELDPETGEASLLSYHAVDDVGTVINPMIVHGQVHGGLAQGIGQALCERTVYDEGQLLSGSFMDYALLRAADLPQFVTELDEGQPCTHNPLGAKGCGESGTIGAPAAVVGALLDALAPLGVRELEMPATPHRVWQAIMRARGGSPG
ncbi:MAG TPA: xanthine dehydrogenase family protein molybdopterin-binding subunit [Burkholderiales bacterium]|nr:xanthine dehydrogenase family protein molybdopterin-binding subunit [Burkholderiales bacterium]